MTWVTDSRKSGIIYLIAYTEEPRKDDDMLMAVLTVVGAGILGIILLQKK